MKWIKKDCYGNEKIWFSDTIINKIKEIVQKTINKRPHSDNTVFENILEIIKEADGNANT